MTTIGKITKSYVKGKAPVIADESKGQVVYLSPEYLRGKSGPTYVTNSPNLIFVRPGEIVLLWDGSNAGEFFTAKAGALASTMTKIEFDQNAFDRQFLYHLFKSVEIILKSGARGSGIPHVDRDVFENISVVEFSKAEQTAIARILSTVDEAIEKTEQLIAKYERIKTGLMHDLLTKGIDEYGRIRSEATHRFKDSPLGRIPEEWEVKSIGEIAEHVKSGITPTGGSKVYQQSGIMLIRSQNVLYGKFDLSDVAFISEEINEQMKRSEVFEFDVLLNITGASIGRSHFIPKNFPRANVNQHVCAIRMKKKAEAKSIFVSSFLNSAYGQNQIITLNAGSNREGLNYQQVREIRLPHPTEDTEFDRIAKLIATKSKIIDELEVRKKKSNSIKRGLLQDLLSGRVRVPEEMIEHIKKYPASITPIGEKVP